MSVLVGFVCHGRAIIGLAKNATRTVRKRTEPPRETGKEGIVTPEDLVPDRETCERLKAAGFPQETYFLWWDKADPVIGRTDGCCGDYAIPDEIIAAAPTAAEIMEELRASELQKVQPDWYHAKSLERLDRWADATTAVKALALLWLVTKEAPCAPVTES